MFKTIPAAFVTVAILFAAAAPAPVAAAGFCSSNSFPNDGSTRQMYIHRVTTAGYTNIAAVAGHATIRNISPCFALNTGSGWTAVLPANIQGTSRIYQLGYWIGSGPDDNHFVYIEGEANNPVTITSVLPNQGERYAFEVYKGTDGDVRFLIKNSLGNTIWSRDSNETYGSDFDVAWWGYESGDSESNLGVDSDLANIKMALYWKNSASASNYNGWQGLTTSLVTKVDPNNAFPNYMHGHIGGTYDEYFNAETH